MASKPGRPPVKTSYKKGDKAALGNDKSMKWATLLERELKKPLGDLSKFNTLRKYEAELERRTVIVNKFIKELVTKGDIDQLAKFLEKRIDREDGMPKQSTDLTTNGKDLPTPIYAGKSWEE